ncbi:hypothetical protein FACS1894111_10950 [Clostridia bacterium]|nr:hypothetical protein FACS1894111_10950 [Clostridia bacterium]
MNDVVAKRRFPVIFILAFVIYVGLFSFLMLLLTDTGSTPAHIDLDKGRMYLRKGFSPSELQDVKPKAGEDGYVDLTGKSWRIESSGLGEPTPFLQPFDLPKEDYTYVLQFDIRSEQSRYIVAKRIQMAFYLPAIAGNYEIFLNGTSISREIHLDADGEIAIHKEANRIFIPFERNHLQIGENTLVFHIIAAPNYQDAGLYSNGGYFLGSYQKIAKQYDESLFYIITGTLLFLMFYNLLVFFANRKERHYLFFGFLNFALSCHFFLQTPSQYLLFADSMQEVKFELVTWFLCGIFMILLIYTLSERKLDLFAKIGLGIGIGINLAVVVSPGLSFLLDLMLLGEIWLVLVLIRSYMVAWGGFWTSVKYVKTAYADRGRLQRLYLSLFDSTIGIVFFASNLVLVCGILGVLQVAVAHTIPQLLLYGLCIVPICISFALAVDTVKTKQSYELQNITLEATVEERTRELSHQIEAVKKANQAKSQFLAMMSHEMRTPMNAILGISEMTMGIGKLPEEAALNLSKISISGKTLLSIINDILDLSKIEAGKMDLYPAQYESASMLNDTIHANIMRIGPKNITFEVEISPELPVHLYGDELRVKQILNNVLSNAFKYTERGTVRLRVEKTSKPIHKDVKQMEDDEVILFTVSDTGCGMKPEDLEQLFAEFTRFNTRANRVTEGTGLGMKITQDLLTLMGGKIEVTSTLGKGSTFRVYIPQKHVSDEQLGVDTVEHLREFTYTNEKQSLVFEKEYMPYGSVLVVDDADTNLYVAKGLMQPYGISVKTALSGYEALDRVRGIQDYGGREYDIIFMDHMMPGMDGVDATREIREMGYTGPIVALTANAVVGQQTFFLENGFDDFISKPIDTKALNDILNKWIRDRHSEEEREAVRSAQETNFEEGGDDMAIYIPGVETERVLAVFGGNEAVYQKILGIYLKDVAKSVKVLEGTIENENWQLFTTTVHAMKSASANIGAMEMSERSKELEFAGKDGDTELIREKFSDYLLDLKQLAVWISRALGLPDPEEEEAENAVSSSGKAEEELFAKHLGAIKEGAKNYDESAIEEALQALEGKEWSKEKQEKLERIRELLSHSEFDEVAEQAAG